MQRVAGSNPCKLGCNCKRHKPPKLNKHPKWLLNPGVGRIHKQVMKLKGKASEHNCVDCGKQALDWSQKHGTDRLSHDSYEPRCRSCHLIYDGARKCQKGCTCRRHRGKVYDGKYLTEDEGEDNG